MIPVIGQNMMADNMIVKPHPDLVFRGITAAESAGTPATAQFVLRHGTSTGGTILIAPANFAAKGFMYPTFLPSPIGCPNGISVQVESGTVTIIVYVDYE